MGVWIKLIDELNREEPSSVNKGINACLYFYSNKVSHLIGGLGVHLNIL